MGSSSSTVCCPCPACMDASLSQQELLPGRQGVNSGVSVAWRYNQTPLVHTCELGLEESHGVRGRRNRQVSAERRMEEGSYYPGDDAVVLDQETQVAQESTGTYLPWIVPDAMAIPDTGRTAVARPVFGVDQDEHYGTLTDTEVYEGWNEDEPYIDEIAFHTDACEVVSPALEQVNMVGYQDTQPMSGEPLSPPLRHVDTVGYQETLPMSSIPLSPPLGQVNSDGYQQTQPVTTELAPGGEHVSDEPETSHYFLKADGPGVI